MKEYDKLDLAPEEFENADIKNQFMAETSKEYIMISNRDVTDCDEAEKLLEGWELSEDPDMLVFCENGPDGQADICTVLACCDMKLFSIVFKRSCLSVSGHFNRGLAAKGNLEFILRVMEKSSVLFIPCVSEGSGEYHMGMEKSYAFIFVKYMVQLKQAGRLEQVFARAASEIKRNGDDALFEQTLTEMLGDREKWKDIARDTAPLFIISGNDTCYGVLHDFAERLADAFAARGEAVVTSNGRYGDSEIPLKGVLYKAVIGFQAPVLKSEYMRGIDGIRLQYWFDNPACFRNEWDYIRGSCYMLACDRYYADFVNKYYNTRNALHFPPAGIDAGLGKNSLRPYDIVFIGTYYVPEEAEQMIRSFPDDIRELAAILEDYLMSHPDVSYDRGFNDVLSTTGIVPESSMKTEMLYMLYPVLQKVQGVFRRNIVTELIEAGYNIHVYGSSWSKFPKKYRHGLILHDAVSPEAAPAEYGKAKIGLNIMTWHKAGMTERVANIMLSGAVCVSEETEYLTEHFVNHEEIELFSLSKIHELPGIIRNILENEEYRKKICKKAYERAGNEHTWDARAGEILRLLDFLYGLS